MNDLHFYSQLQPMPLSAAQALRQGNFVAVPESWHLIVSDVRNSTQAVADGRHTDVNAVAAGSLVAALNVAQQNSVEIPFFFGGDGSVLVVPPALLPETIAALKAHADNTAANLGLQLHSGSVPVKNVYAAGYTLQLAKLAIDDWFTKAVLTGNGLRWAEDQIKAGAGADSAVAGALNLAGLECRWNKIKPAVVTSLNGCYLIEALNPAMQTTVYADVLDTLEAIFGNEQKRNPLSPKRLKVLLSFRKINREMKMRFGRWKPGYFLVTALRNLIAPIYLGSNRPIGGMSGREYLNQLIAHADTLTIDGRINTIICGDAKQHERFLNYLRHEEAGGRLFFGHHFDRQSIMTCYIQSRNRQHIHFVDGADGGYTEAAKELKVKFKKLSVA